MHWYEIANAVHLPSFISLLIAPIAAKQGAQRRLNTRKLNASGFVNTNANDWYVFKPSFVNRLARVATIFSLATSPVMEAPYHYE